MKTRILLSVAGFVCGIGLPAGRAAHGGETGATHKRSITQYGITWTLQAPARAGRFVTGDWWVVGPATVISVSPAPTGERHGSAVNPPAGDRQCYDSRMRGFDGTLAARFPLVLRPGQSLVSTASVEKIGQKTPDTVPGQYCLGPLRTAVVLTCLVKRPPADALRPAYVGAWKEMFTASQFRGDLLPRLRPPANVPDIKRYERFLERIWLDHQRGWVNRYMHPLENMPDYGREITNIVSDVGLLLLLEDQSRRTEALLLRFVQKGIDYYGVVQSDSNLWGADGGHNSGRKWPILFAGLMLDHAGMLSVQATFAEDAQTYYAHMFHGREHEEKVALWRIHSSRRTGAHHEEVSPSEWKTYGSGSNNGVKADAYRRLNGPTWVGQALAARLTGVVECWNHKAFFDYVDRWVKNQGAGRFVGAMWETYREKADGIGAEVQARRKKKKKESKAIILPDGTEIVIVGGIALRRRRRKALASGGAAPPFGKRTERSSPSPALPKARAAAKAPAEEVVAAVENEPQEAPEIRRLLKEAETLFIDGEIEKATDIFSRIVRENPDTPSAEKAREYLDLMK